MSKCLQISLVFPFLSMRFCFGTLFYQELNIFYVKIWECLFADTFVLRCTCVELDETGFEGAVMSCYAHCLWLYCLAG